MSFLLSFGSERFGGSRKEKRSRSNLAWLVANSYEYDDGLLFGGHGDHGNVDSNEFRVDNVDEVYELEEEEDSVSPSILCVDDLCHCLSTNRIDCLEIGFAENNYLQSLRSVRDIDRAVHQNSSLRSIRVGWKYLNKGTLFYFLRSIASSHFSSMNNSSHHTTRSDKNRLVKKNNKKNRKNNNNDHNYNNNEYRHNSNHAGADELIDLELVLNNREGVEESILLQMFENHPNLARLHLQSLQVDQHYQSKQQVTASSMSSVSMSTPTTTAPITPSVVLQKRSRPSLSGCFRHGGGKNKIRPNSHNNRTGGSSNSSSNNESAQDNSSVSTNASPNNSNNNKMKDNHLEAEEEYEEYQSYCGIQSCSELHSHQQLQQHRHCVVNRVLIPSIPQLAHLKVLNLVDCNVDDDSIHQVSTFLQQHYQYHTIREQASTAFLDDRKQRHVFWSDQRAGVTSVSLRGNRALGRTGIGLANLLRDTSRQTLLQRLDVSLCEVTVHGAQLIASAIAQRTAPLHELVLSGNYQIETNGWKALLSPECCANLASLDISTCDISEHDATNIFQTLQATFEYINKNNNNNTGNGSITAASRLQRLVMRRCRIANDRAIGALASLLLLTSSSSSRDHHSMSLRSLHLNDPVHPQYLSTKQLRTLLPAMEWNYDVEILELDRPSVVPRTNDNDDNNEQEAPDPSTAIWKEIDFYLSLNRAGRRILRSQISSSSSNGEQQARNVNNKKKKQNWMHMMYGSNPVTALYEAASQRRNSNDLCQAFARAASFDDPTVAYWMVRECSPAFFFAGGHYRPSTQQQQQR